jgi:hypothetical protein
MLKVVAFMIITEVTEEYSLLKCSSGMYICSARLHGATFQKIVPFKFIIVLR